MQPWQRFVSVLVLAYAGTALGGCSGSGESNLPGISSGTPAPGNTPVATKTTARVRVTLTVPADPAPGARRRRPDYVSAATHSASIGVSSGGTAAGSPTILNCSSGQTCSTIVVAPIGTDTFTITAYASTGGQGSALGIGSASQAVASGADNVVYVTLDGIVNSVDLVVTTPTSLPAGTAATETVSVNALDAAGDTIVAPGGYVDPSDNPVTISVTNTDYGGGKGKTTLTNPSPAPAVTGPGATLSYAYNGNDIDATVFTTSTSSTVAGSQGSATVTYVPTLIKRVFDTATADTNFITTGADGNLWFTDFASGAIGSIVPGTQAITHYTIPSNVTTGGAEPEGIVAGPNSTMYVAEFNSNAIGSISTSTAATLGSSTPVTETDLTTTNANPRGIAYDATCSPNVWFTEYNGNKIGTLSTTTMTVTEYDTGLTAGALPDQIACGPDGNFWFAEYGANKIGQITPAGTITEYALPNPTAPHGPLGIVKGADGSMWFTEYNGNMISRIVTSKTLPADTVGTVYEYPLPPPPPNSTGSTMAPAIITSAPDGDLFFSEFNSETSTTNAMIGRLKSSASVAPGSIAGTFAQFPLADTSNMPFGVTVGPDGHIWYDEMGSDYIGFLIY